MLRGKVKKSTLYYLIIILAVPFLGCNEEDQNGSTISTRDLQISVAENPVTGQSLGTITGTSNEANINFSIRSQTPDGGLSINATSGELTVLDSLVFDFETNPVIEAIIDVSNSTVSQSSDLTITVTDVFEVIWTSQAETTEFGAVYDHKIVAADSLIMIGGQRGSSRLNEIWYSTNGTGWTQVSTEGSIFSPVTGHEALVFSDTLWVLGGEADAGLMSGVWYSLDAKSWTEQSTGQLFPPRTDHAAVVFNDSLWVVGGNTGTVQNDIWKSGDGLTWSQVTISGDLFSARQGHTLTSFGGQLWVIGGTDNTGTLLNDVWQSEDGTTWTQVETTGNLFSPRTQHSLVSSNGLLWIIGGLDSEGNYLNDTWLSSDGASWTRQVTATVFSERAQIAPFIFNSTVWVNGGRNTSGTLEDIWQSN